MASKFGNIKDLWSNLDTCIRDRTSWIELGSAATGGYPAMLKLLAEKAQECSADPNTQYRTAVQLAELFGQTPPKQSDFGINADGTVGKGTTMNDGRGSQTVGDPADQAKNQHDDIARAISYQLLGTSCTSDIQLPGNTWSRCRTGMDGYGYTIDTSRYPLTNKQFVAIKQAVQDAAALGTTPDDMLARGQAAATAELAKLGIGAKLPGPSGGPGMIPGEVGPGMIPTGGDPGSTGTSRPQKSNTVAMAGLGLLGGAIALVGAWYIAKAVKAK